MRSSQARRSIRSGAVFTEAPALAAVKTENGRGRTDAFKQEEGPKRTREEKKEKKKKNTFRSLRHNRSAGRHRQKRRHQRDGAACQPAQAAATLGADVKALEHKTPWGNINTGG